MVESIVAILKGPSDKVGFRVTRFFVDFHVCIRSMKLLKVNLRPWKPTNTSKSKDVLGFYSAAFCNEFQVATKVSEVVSNLIYEGGSFFTTLRVECLFERSTVNL
jgi:hypothetical protein